MKSKFFKMSFCFLPLIMSISSCSDFRKAVGKEKVIPDEFLVPGSLVFITGRAAATSYSSIDWWKWSPNTNWKNPRLENPTLDGFGDHPVVHVSWYDATEFSLWSGMQLPTEAQWEYAAKLGNVTNTREMNIWQGIFHLTLALELSNLHRVVFFAYLHTFL